jgi:multisubunit Na+/H+ antiporter MnhE subunit
MCLFFFSASFSMFSLFFSASFSMFSLFLLSRGAVAKRRPD